MKLSELPSYFQLAAVPTTVLLMVLALASALLPTLILSVSKLRRRSRSAKEPIEATMIPEAKECLRKHESIGKWFNRMHSLLTFLQFVVGGVLASSFVQAHLDPPVVGTLGLVVLLSSLMHRHYRPDLIARGAERRSLTLRTGIREAENTWFKSNNPPPVVTNIRDQITQILKTVEESEFDEGVGETTLLDADRTTRV